MIYLILALVVMAGVVYFLFQSNRKKKAEISKLGTRVVELSAETVKLNHLIHGIQEVNRETTEKKKKIRTGTNSDKFNNSLDILSELPAKSGAGKDRA